MKKLIVILMMDFLVMIVSCANRVTGTDENGDRTKAPTAEEVLAHLKNNIVITGAADGVVKSGKKLAYDDNGKAREFQTIFNLNLNPKKTFGDLRSEFILEFNKQKDVTDNYVKIIEDADTSYCGEFRRRRNNYFYSYY